MIIYPEIAIKNGRCVTLRKGQMTLPEEHDTSPLDLARHYAAHGAEWLHVADLDATGRHSHDNTALVEHKPLALANEASAACVLAALPHDVSEEHPQKAASGC